ncbi:MAG: nitrous oxide reductase family maturation protein NosD [Gammaproteobacteria bacterium]|nr:nitrous oxide reductase family maturation protein NosD [Gammaproteobacteria bacterium]MCW8928588.1 nitrous oxide reductase family maturation protein NosD [Gammaproteobacteria bacterium]MCW8958346.1 nitrous oxide reductase family maturation protein NosD [Gammaproteobacteria bacterium]MCW8972606.1 nitrous oxide reductase family maturation protein NosD [Gammaproteobacteria bacterium]MCW8992552.1 nitrous oxide reductase family maturation protein NosD [Gammaproteobacteria bacterium]
MIKDKFFVVWLLLLTAAPTLAASDWPVTAGSTPLPEVIAQASPGDRLLLSPGRYRVNLLLDKPLVIEGQPGAVLDGGGEGDVIRIVAEDVTLKGLEITGSGRDLTDMNALIFVERSATRTRIENNRLQGDVFGVWVDGARDVHIINNTIQGNPDIRSQDRGNGVHLFSATGAVVDGNEIMGTRDGIYIDTSNHNRLSNNYIHHLRYGIHYMYSYHNEVVGNTTDTTRTGYALMQSKFLTVTGNRSKNDQNYGILLNFIVSSHLQGNTVEGVRAGTSRINGGYDVGGAEGKAIFIYNSQFNTLQENQFLNSDIGIHITAGSEDNKIFNNAFVRNKTQVKYVATRKQEWSHEGMGNYWSDYIGYDMNSDGRGDTVYEPNDGIDRVLWKYPIAKLLLHSPAVETLHWVQRQFPVLRPQGVKDSYPLIRMPDSVREL